ncbi:SDR family NAD(P)-dependent oxidoreductase [Paracoccus sp. P2]|uniref:SDR family oxidoreductase n=1 Tax=Paracoccus pantotrophus TaxID=82367 RepID=A0A7H9BV75_PARPN|nr:SDR family oxidoreductase [Paracoccus pantotrophus]MDF3855596.1 SDR family oxidoreductase [Paracoccus pantotrophus]QLH13821.1 SDR family oxidoreductase [Paracoccus pantotrophus]RDD96242.1 SDR family NAD(P)-dependent oxidoreductase [Paracoccus pantotrophus]RNI17555.1 SDR family oxidoreductase [Paracoccus pantotrophus]WGR67043.1 SDR family oxidoreductase [Paracoccus pantotrophus]
MPSEALVTGGAEGIGWAIAQALAAQGCRVTIADLDGDKAALRAAELGAGHRGIRCDVTDEVQARAAAAVAPFGILVNNAGIGDSHLPTLDQDLTAFRRVLDVHLSGTFLMTRQVARGMLARGRGAVVNLSSIAGLTGLPRRNAYGAAKAGIVAMTRAMACEWAGQGLRVNAVAPAFVETALVRTLAEAGRIDLPAIRRRTPLGRLIEAREVAAAVAFLASDAASGITGAVLPVDGGWTAFGDFGEASRPD